MKTAERTLFLATVLSFIIIADCLAQNPQRPFPNSDWKKTDTLGVTIVRISYEMTFRKALSFNSSEIDNDTFGMKQDFSDHGCATDSRIIEIGNGIKKDYSQILEETEQENRKITTGAAPNLAKPIYPYEFITLQDGRFITTVRFLNIILRYEDSSGKIQWALTGRNSTIDGLNCSEATTHLCGRDYAAWFCPGIPIDGGPWKFHGLPGIIVKVDDTEGHYSWKMTGLEKGSWPIYEKQYNFRKCDKAEAEKAIQNMYAHPFAFIKAIGIKFHVVENGKTREPGKAELEKSFYYDPLELE